MPDPKMKVTLTLPLAVGRRLKAMCHHKGLSASTLLEAWISQHNDEGDLRIRVEVDPQRRPDAIRELLEEVRRGRKTGTGRPS